MNHMLDIVRSALLTDISMCLAYYRMSSPGLYCCTLVPVQLDENTRLTPGVMLMVNYGRHKQCTTEPSHQFFTGPPTSSWTSFPRMTTSLTTNSAARAMSAPGCLNMSRCGGRTR
jgi:hypothetical protein